MILERSLSKWVTHYPSQAEISKLNDLKRERQILPLPFPTNLYKSEVFLYWPPKQTHRLVRNRHKLHKRFSNKVLRRDRDEQTTEHGHQVERNRRSTLREDKRRIDKGRFCAHGSTSCLQILMGSNAVQNTGDLENVQYVKQLYGISSWHRAACERVNSRRLVLLFV